MSLTQLGVSLRGALRRCCRPALCWRWWWGPAPLELLQPGRPELERDYCRWKLVIDPKEKVEEACGGPRCSPARWTSTQLYFREEGGLKSDLLLQCCWCIWDAAFSCRDLTDLSHGSHQRYWTKMFRLFEHCSLFHVFCSSYNLQVVILGCTIKLNIMKSQWDQVQQI